MRKLSLFTFALFALAGLTGCRAVNPCSADTRIYPAIGEVDQETAVWIWLESKQ